MKMQVRGWKAAPTGEDVSSVIFILISDLCLLLAASCQLDFPLLHAPYPPHIPLGIAKTPQGPDFLLLGSLIPESGYCIVCR